ncbi:glycosyltransferase family 25 protein [Amphibiibacter pelophylacis]|uniref:Glycosyltransferase family 25 protein n=1 Tax=Amphibiibacter pelophylacis TaxID=1799477 RepID=A0ACC6NZD9_9BURK
MTTHIYLINLDGSDERLASATGQLVAQGIAFERVAAVDGRAGVDQFGDLYDAARARAYMGRELRGGELGCYLSHVRCAERFLATDAPYAIVLEDDMQMLQPLAPLVAMAVDWLERHGHSGWDVFNIGNQKLKIFTPLTGFGPEYPGVRLARAHYFPMTTTGLVWSRAGAQAFIETSGRIFCPVDNFLRHWQTRRNTGYCFWPPLLTTTGSESQIDGAAAQAASRARVSGQRSSQGRQWHYGLAKQRRLWLDKLIAARHKWLG